MWKKDDTAAQTPAAPPERTPRLERAPAPASGAQAMIGRSITVRGDLSGEEDLAIQGRVEGSVDLGQHAVTVGPDGRVKASIIGRVVTVEGRVEGNINAAEQVVLRSSALVLGDIAAPRVVLENGARFRGGVDMGDVDEGTERTGVAAAPEARKATESRKPTPEPATPAPGANVSMAAKTKRPNDIAAEMRT